MKTIFLLDMDQFYAAVEMRLAPWLKGKPVIVGASPEGRGIVTTASYEARRYGVRSGMSGLDAVRLCPHAQFVRPDFNKYVTASCRIVAILREFTERVEPVSVDEAFIDVSDIVWSWGGVEALAMTMKRRIVEREGLTATIGAGANKLVAKVASGMNKPDGFTYLPPDVVPRVFATLPVGDLYGVGKKTQAVLEGFGIRTAGQLAAFPIDVLARRFGKFGIELARAARGEGEDLVRVPEQREQEKSMGHDHTFHHDQTDPKQLLGRLHLLCERVARRLRAANMAGRCVAVRIRYHGFETVIHGHKVKSYLQHEIDLYPVAERLFHESYRMGTPVRLVGIHISELKPTNEIVQQELFIAPPDTDDLSRACDEIKERFGENAIGFASGVFHTGDTVIRKGHRTPFFNPFYPYLLHRREK